MDYNTFYSRLVRLYSVMPRIAFRGYAFPPLQLFIELTRRCNLRCVMCQNQPYVAHVSVTSEKEKELTLEELDRIVSQTSWFTVITLTGGEPLLRKDFRDILTCISSKRRCHVITNGVLLDKDMAQLMVKSAPRNLFSRGLLFVGISMHGPAEVHDRITQLDGSFALATDGARYLAESKASANSKFPVVYLGAVLTKDTVETLPEMVSIAREVSASIFNVVLHNTSLDLSILRGATMETMGQQPVPPERIEPEHLRAKLSETLRRGAELGVQVRLPRMPISEIVNYYAGKWQPSGYTCYTPWSKTYVSPYGQVYACHQYEVGNLREKPLKNIWNNAQYRRFRLALKQRDVFPICAACCEIECSSRVSPLP